MSHNERAIVGSVRVAPRKATPIKFSLTVSDLAGYWTGGIVTSTDYYNSSGQYQSNSLTAVNYGYTDSVRQGLRNGEWTALGPSRVSGHGEPSSDPGDYEIRPAS